MSPAVPAFGMSSAVTVEPYSVARDGTVDSHLDRAAA
jgi:hypothetical protein